MSTEHLACDVVVLGAGAAGLAAARALHADGLTVIVLEARDRIGGRVLTVTDAGTTIDLGAELIHGRAEELHRIAQAASLASMEIEGTRWVANAGRLSPLDDFWKRIDTVMRAARVRGRDRSFLDALRQHKRRLPAAYRRLAIEFVEGFHAADPTDISAHALAESGSPGGDVREQRLGRFQDGYGSVIAWLARPIANCIRVETVASTVRWQPGRVDVEADSASHSGGISVQASAAVITVPLGVLKAAAGEIGAIEFVPGLPQKQAPLESLVVGSARKIVLRFTDRFWAGESFARRKGVPTFDTASFIHGAGSDFPVWWTAYPQRLPWMVGWCGGPRAHALAGADPRALTDRALTALAGNLGVSVRTLRGKLDGSWSHDWDRDPFARGAYSYQRVGGAAAPASLARPVADTLFFAGEATDRDGATGTVHGAIASGERSAAAVLRRHRSR